MGKFMKKHGGKIFIGIVLFLITLGLYYYFKKK